MMLARALGGLLQVLLMVSYLGHAMAAMYVLTGAL